MYKANHICSKKNRLEKLPTMDPTVVYVSLVLNRYVPACIECYNFRFDHVNFNNLAFAFLSQSQLT